MAGGNKPDATVFAVIKGQKPDDSTLVRVGVAWKSKTGAGGYTLVIETIPTAWLGRAQRDVRLQLVPRGANSGA